MHGRQVQGGLSGVLGRSTHSRQEQWPARDRLHPGLGVGGPAETTPPVVDQGHTSGARLASLDVLGGETTSVPLVLELVKAIFCICSVSVEY